MATRIAINGFGRIGRNVLRALHETGRRDLEIVAINDLAPAPKLAHLLRFDSVHGRFPGTIEATEKSLDIGKGPIEVTACRNLEDLKWDDNGVDIVMECTGIFKSREQAQGHISAGAKKVLISAPAKGDVDNTIVYGVNHDTLKADHKIVSNASCTTNGLAPIAKALHAAFGVKNGFMTTIHAYTGDQPTLDTVHSDPARGRAAALSMVPTSTGAAKAIGLVVPELAGKLDGKAIRVPTPNVSVVDLTVNVETATDEAAVNAALTEAAKSMPGILQVIDQPLVSVDLNHDAHSSSAMLGETVVMDKTLVRVLSWYDNEWGFSNRMLDTAALMASLT